MRKPKNTTQTDLLTRESVSVPITQWERRFPHESWRALAQLNGLPTEVGVSILNRTFNHNSCLLALAAIRRVNPSATLHSLWPEYYDEENNRRSRYTRRRWVASTASTHG